MSFGKLGALGRGFGRLGGGLGGVGNTPAPPNTLIAGVGSFLVTGVDMTPEVDYVGAADVGAFTLTGVSAGLLYGRSLAAAAGSFALTGVDATLTKSSGYTGPGDVFAFDAWFSPARAYSAAFAALAGPIMDIADQANAHPLTVNILTTGFADVAAINAWVLANSVTGIVVKKLYDQTNNGNHVVQATLSNMPALTLTSTPRGTLPVITSSGTQFLQTSGTYTQAQPYTLSAVLRRTSGTGAGGVIGSNASDFIGPGAGANLASVNGGSAITKAATDNTWYAMQGVINGASSAINVDGSDSTGNAGANAFSSNNIRLCRGASNEHIGDIAEAGIKFGTAANLTQRGDINTNQHGASGYSW